MSDYRKIVQAASDQLQAVLGYRTDTIDTGIGQIAKENARLRAELVVATVAKNAAHISIDRLQTERDAARTELAAERERLLNMHVSLIRVLEKRCDDAELAAANARGDKLEKALQCLRLTLDEVRKDAPGLRFVGNISLEKLDALVADALNSDAKPAREIVRHKKTGGTYEVVGRAMLQASNPLKDCDEMIIYRSTEGGLTFVRSTAEFSDGRFENAE